MKVYLSRSLQSAIFPLLLYIWSIHYGDYVFIHYALVYQVLHKNYLAIDFICKLKLAVIPEVPATRLMNSQSVRNLPIFFRQRKQGFTKEKSGLGFYVWHKISSVIWNAKRCQSTWIYQLSWPPWTGRDAAQDRSHVGITKRAICWRFEFIWRETDCDPNEAGKINMTCLFRDHVRGGAEGFAPHTLFTVTNKYAYT